MSDGLFGCKTDQEIPRYYVSVDERAMACFIEEGLIDVTTLPVALTHKVKDYRKVAKFYHQLDFSQLSTLKDQAIRQIIEKDLYLNMPDGDSYRGLPFFEIHRKLSERYTLYELNKALTIYSQRNFE